MTDLDQADDTQKAILPHLRMTERLLAEAATLASGGVEQEAQIVPMPDLGLPHSVLRMHGGFFTGACYSWTSSAPFVPVDATVNVCGASLFRLRGEVPTRVEFERRIRRARDLAEKAGYVWNWDRSNHFITLLKCDGNGALREGIYFALHSSAAEFKNQPHGLYPTPRNWYANHIRVYQRAGALRRLRYLSGMVAEHFHLRAKMLEAYNADRHRWFAGAIMGAESLDEEIFNQPHYGMPDQNSVAIGCMWQSGPKPYLLLTAPGRPLYWIEPKKTNARKSALLPTTNRFTLQPHGLGLRLKKKARVDYGMRDMRIGGAPFKPGDSMGKTGLLGVRGAVDDDRDLQATVALVLRSCPGRVTAQLEPLVTHASRGPKNFQAHRHG